MRSLTLVLAFACYADPPPKCIVKITQGDKYTSGAAYAMKSVKNTNGVLILTCAHNRDNEQEVKVYWPGVVAASVGKVIAVDEDRDLAVIRVEDSWPGMKFYPIIPKDRPELVPRSEVRLTGYGANGYYSRHTVVLGAGEFNSRRLIRTEAVARKGDSGSPVIMNGWLCGVMQAGMTGASSATNAGEALFLGHREIWEFLEENELKP